MREVIINQAPYPLVDYLGGIESTTKHINECLTGNFTGKYRKKYVFHSHLIRDPSKQDFAFTIGDN